MSHGRGNPDPNVGRGLNDAEDESDRSHQVGPLEQQERGRRLLGSQISASYSEDGRAVPRGQGRTGIRHLHRKHGPCTQDRRTQQTSLQGIAQKARSQQEYRFRNLYGRLNEELLKDGRRDMRTDTAYGVDEVCAPAYERDLDGNISHLGERLQRKRYRAKLVRRQSIPTENGQLRPLGIPTVEDKRLRLAVTRILTGIDEQDVLRCSYGYRPHMGALDAVDTLTIKQPFGRYNWMVEADITGFFDNLAQAWMIRMLAERIEDRAGKDRVARRTARLKRRNPLRRFTQWCREHCNLRLGVLFVRLNAKLRGYYNDYGVHGTFASLKQCLSQALGILKKWLDWRSHRRSYTWAGYPELLAHFTIERPRIVARPQNRFAASKA